MVKAGLRRRRWIAAAWVAEAAALAGYLFLALKGFQEGGAFPVFGDDAAGEIRVMERLDLSGLLAAWVAAFPDSGWDKVISSGLAMLWTCVIGLGTVSAAGRAAEAGWPFVLLVFLALLGLVNLVWNMNWLLDVEG